MRSHLSENIFLTGDTWLFLEFIANVGNVYSQLDLPWSHVTWVLLWSQWLEYRRKPFLQFPSLVGRVFTLSKFPLLLLKKNLLLLFFPPFFFPILFPAFFPHVFHHSCFPFPFYVYSPSCLYFPHFAPTSSFSICSLLSKLVTVWK